VGVPGLGACFVNDQGGWWLFRGSGLVGGGVSLLFFDVLSDFHFLFLYFFFLVLFLRFAVFFVPSSCNPCIVFS